MEEYDQYDPGGMSIEDLYARLIQLQSRISSTVSMVKREDGAIKEQQSQIIQEVDEISLEVFTINTTTGSKESNIAKLSVRSDEIESSVSSLDTRLGSAESSITQNANQIALKVSATDYNGEQIISLIEQTAAEIMLKASKIELYGLTTVHGTLYIGDPDEYTTKTLWFNNAANLSATGFGYGGVSELQFGTSNLNFEQVYDLYFDYTNATRFNGKIDFANATVTGLNVTVQFG